MTSTMLNGAVNSPQDAARRSGSVVSFGTAKSNQSSLVRLTARLIGVHDKKINLSRFRYLTSNPLHKPRLPMAGHDQPVHRTGHGDVGQSYFVGFAVVLAGTETYPRNRHDRKLQLLRRLEGHNLNAVDFSLN